MNKTQILCTIFAGVAASGVGFVADQAINGERGRPMTVVEFPQYYRVLPPPPTVWEQAGTKVQDDAAKPGEKEDREKVFTSPPGFKEIELQLQFIGDNVLIRHFRSGTGRYLSGVIKHLRTNGLPEPIWAEPFPANMSPYNTLG